MPELRPRVIPPDYWMSHRLGFLDDMDRLLFIFLTTYADDFGRFEFQPHTMRGLFWMHHPERSTEDFISAFERVTGACHYIKPYMSEDRIFYYFSNWTEYQKIQKPRRSSVPSPESLKLSKNFSEKKSNSEILLERAFKELPSGELPSGERELPSGEEDPPTPRVSSGKARTDGRSAAPEGWGPEDDSAFSEWWALYPAGRPNRKAGQETAAFAAFSAVPREQRFDLIAATVLYRDGQRVEYYRAPQNFLAAGYWRSYLEPVPEGLKIDKDNGNGRHKSGTERKWDDFRTRYGRKTRDLGADPPRRVDVREPDAEAGRTGRDAARVGKNSGANP